MASASTGSTTTCWTGRSAPLSMRPTTLRRSQPEVAAGKVETMISSTCSSWTTLSAAVTGSGSPMWPVASTPSRFSSASALSSRSCTPGWSAGATSVKSVGADRARSRIASSSGPPTIVWLAITRTWIRSRGEARSTSTWVTGMSLATLRARSMRPPRSQLERTAPGCVEMMISSTGAYWCRASRSAWSGSGSTIAPRAAIPASCSRSSVRRSRRSALDRRLSS